MVGFPFVHFKLLKQMVPTQKRRPYISKNPPTYPVAFPQLLMMKILFHKVFGVCSKGMLEVP